MRFFSFLLAAAVVGGSSLFSMGDEHNHEATSTTNQQTIQATGTVKMIADNHESIRIFHDPIAELKWPAMNMPFAVQNHELIHALNPGDKVEFEFVQNSGKNTIVRIKKQ